MKYICKDCTWFDACELDTGNYFNAIPPTRCVSDGSLCNWQNAEACALADAAKEGE